MVRNKRHVAVGIEAVTDTPNLVRTSTGRIDVWVNDDELAKAVRTARELAGPNKFEVLPGAGRGRSAVVLSG